MNRIEWTYYKAGYKDNNKASSYDIDDIEERHFKE